MDLIKNYVVEDDDTSEDEESHPVNQSTDKVDQVSEKLLEPEDPNESSVYD